VIEASTNLTSWVPLITNTPVDNRLPFFESITNFPTRFYRGRLP